MTRELELWRRLRHELRVSRVVTAYVGHLLDELEQHAQARAARRRERRDRKRAEAPT